MCINVQVHIIYGIRLHLSAIYGFAVAAQRFDHKRIWGKRGGNGSAQRYSGHSRPRLAHVTQSAHNTETFAWIKYPS